MICVIFIWHNIKSRNWKKKREKKRDLFMLRKMAHSLQILYICLSWGKLEHWKSSPATTGRSTWGVVIITFAGMHRGTKMSYAKGFVYGWHERWSEPDLIKVLYYIFLSVSTGINVVVPCVVPPNLAKFRPLIISTSVELGTVPKPRMLRSIREPCHPWYVRPILSSLNDWP